MKTKTTTQVIVKDGKSNIADWTQQFEHRPTVGDRIRIPDDVVRTLDGYEPEAVISMEEIDRSTGDFRIIAEAQCNLPTDQRAVVTLNASLLPERIHKEVEDHVRRRLDLPVIMWEESSITTPIIRLHPFKSQLRTPLNTLQSELRVIHDRAVALAPC